MVAQCTWPNSESFIFLKEYTSGKNINLISLWVIMTYFIMQVDLLWLLRITAYLSETSNFTFLEGHLYLVARSH